MTDVKRLPKIELHRHLEGSVRPATILEIARKYGHHLPSHDPEDLKQAICITQPMDSILQVFEHFRWAQRCFATPEDISRIAREIAVDAAIDNVVLLELRFSPSFMTEIHPLPWGEVLDAVSAGIREARENHEIEVGLVVICSRDLGVDRCDETVDFCLNHRDSVVGVDLAGDESRWPARRFASTFRRASQGGLNITIHAGEIGPPSEVEDALTLLHADRIGHGVAIADSPTLLRDIVDSRVPLELCPTSNWITRSVGSISGHPLPTFLRAGVRVTISSDDPEIFGITLSGEYDLCMREMGLSLEEIRTCNQHALAATFLPADAKRSAAEHTLLA